MVTAGHCALGRHCQAIFIKAYVGYHGRDPGTGSSDMVSDIEYRRGMGAAVPVEWAEVEDWVFDVAFIKLQQPSDHAICVRYAATQNSLTEKVWVVAYPADRERGKRMYQGTGNYHCPVSEKPFQDQVKHTVQLSMVSLTWPDL